jgi:hypothetical protein
VAKTENRKLKTEKGLPTLRLGSSRMESLTRRKIEKKESTAFTGGVLSNKPITNIPQKKKSNN